MSDQGALFDATPVPVRPWQQSVSAATRARDEAIHRVDENADAEWKDRAFEALQRVATEQPTLIADDVWRYIERPREPRATGPLMLRGSRHGIIRATNRYVPVPSALSHAAPVRVWESLIYREAAS